MTITCVVSGRPSPVLQWRLPSRMPSRRILRPGQSDGRMSVSTKGQLKIENARLNDTGTYICTVNNVAGRDRVKNLIKVIRKLLDACASLLLRSRKRYLLM